jgi:hypothetical protein
VSEYPTIRTTPAELHTEQFWAREIEPIAHTFGFDAEFLQQDSGDRHAHLLKSPLGQLVLVVRTDAEPMCCPYHDRFPTTMLGCDEIRARPCLIGWSEVYGGGA